jgi:hypothetical protein
VGVREVSIFKHDTGEVGIREVGAREVGVWNNIRGRNSLVIWNGVIKLSPAELSICYCGSVEVGAGEVGTREVDTG